jgi:hypothetical protein
MFLFLSSLALWCMRFTSGFVNNYALSNPSSALPTLFTYLYYVLAICAFCGAGFVLGNTLRIGLKHGIIGKAR